VEAATLVSQKKFCGYCTDTVLPADHAGVVAPATGVVVEPDA
jgi:ribosomal protein S27AE